MDTLSTLLSIALVWGIAAATPGPNFFVTLRGATGHSRRQGLATAGGVVSGTVIWGLAGFFGISTLFALAPWLYAALKVVGGAYLVYLGLRLIAASFRSGPAAAPEAAAAAPNGRAASSDWAAWRLGLTTNLANPKTAAFVTSLFATTLPSDPTTALGLMAVAVMALVSLTWYGGVAIVFAAPGMARAYARLARVIDRLAGGVFVLFGAKLALDR